MDFDLTVSEKGALVLSRPGQDDLADVRVRRAFPWSHPDRFVSVRSKEGKELLLVDDVATLPAEVAGKLRAALRDGVMIPKIRAILELEHGMGPQRWTVDTDRGTVSFRVQEKEDLRFLPDGRFSVKDADGNIYELAPEPQLDPRSRKLLQFLI